MGVGGGLAGRREAQRTTTTERIDLLNKYRAHYEFVRQRKHEEHFGVARLRAVLTEAPDAEQADFLRRLTEHPVVLGGRGCKPSPLFWFTSSEFFTKLLDIEEGQPTKRTHKIPRWLADPTTIARPIWFTPVDDEPQSLLHHSPPTASCLYVATNADVRSWANAPAAN